MIKKIVVFLIKAYQWMSAPFKQTKTCCFEPTCSSYAIEAIETKGVLLGSWLSIKRIARCHPWQKNPGYDPLPKG